MDEMKKSILLVSTFFIFAIFGIEIAFAKSYSYSYINMVLNLEKNGSVFVSQERAYDFSGSFSWAYLDLKKKGSSDIDFIEIKDLDIDRELTYDIEEDTEHVKATWHYSAYNEVKRFLIVYEIKDAIKRYNDVAEFYWKIIEDEHEYIRNFNAEVNLPEPSPNLFKLFVHSMSKPGTMTFSDDLKRVSVVMRDIPRNQFVEFRLLTSPSIFNEVQLIERNKYESILNEEKLNLFQNLILTNTIFIHSILFIPLVIIFLYFYFKYGVEPKVKYEGVYEREPPMKIPPMALSNLLEGEEEHDETNIKREAMGLLATIFDLARRNYIEIKEEKRKGFLGLKEHIEQIFILTKKGKERTNELESFEKEALSLIFNCGSDKDKVTSSEISEYCRKNPFSVKWEIKNIDKKSRNWFEKNYFPINEKISSKKKRKFQAIMGIYTFFIFIAYFFFLKDVVLLVINFVSIFVTFFLSEVISKRTYMSAYEVKRWNAFKKFITDFSAIKEAPSYLIYIWDEYLVYAIVLGVATKFLKNLQRLADEQHITFSTVVWYHGYGTTRISTGIMSPDSFSSLVSNLSSTINALSSSTSVGGGFSGGGGGGGGGGGSGAG